jgi:hypothetical protein
MGGKAVEGTMQTILRDLVSGDLLARQLTTVKTVNIGFMEGFTENPLATLLVMGAVLFVLSLACRYLIYGIVRTTGREKYDTRIRAMENMWVMLAFGLGVVAGEVCFQNLWLAAMTGGGFAVISVGAVLEALVANERSRRDRLTRGLSV